jgi:hypothetical protein
MNKRRAWGWGLAAAFAAFAVVCGQADARTAKASSRTAPQSSADHAGADVKRRLAGTWMLVNYEIFGENGQTRPGNFDVGRLTYGDQEMDAHLLRSGGKQAPTTDAARAEAFRAYLGYFGPYTIDTAKKTIVHHVAGSSRPDWIGTDQVRHYGFSSDGKQLMLSLKSGERTTQTLTWERVR